MKKDMKQVNLFFEESALERIRKAARSYGLSMASFIRMSALEKARENAAKKKEELRQE